MLKKTVLFLCLFIAMFAYFVFGSGWYEPADLLISGPGKYHDYNFYRYAGVTAVGEKGTHIQEAPPVNVKSNLP